MSEKKQKGEWGGKREGAGRKPLGPSTLVRVTVRLDPGVLDQLKALGGGNLSEGIREAARLLLDKKGS